MTISYFYYYIIAKAHEDAINWDSKELLESSLSHIFWTETESQGGADWAHTISVRTPG